MCNVFLLLRFGVCRNGPEEEKILGRRIFTFPACQQRSRSGIHSLEGSEQSCADLTA